MQGYEAGENRWVIQPVWPSAGRLKYLRERLRGPGGTREGAPRILATGVATISPASTRWISWLEPVKRLADTGFMARLMMLCSLPRTNPGTQHFSTNVSTDPYTLIMTAVGQTELPFGNLSRLLLAWVCTEAVRTQSRELVPGGLALRVHAQAGHGSDRGR